MPGRAGPSQYHGITESRHHGTRISTLHLKFKGADASKFATHTRPCQRSESEDRDSGVSHAAEMRNLLWSDDAPWVYDLCADFHGRLRATARIHPLVGLDNERSAAHCFEGDDVPGKFRATIEHLRRRLSLALQAEGREIEGRGRVVEVRP